MRQITRIKLRITFLLFLCGLGIGQIHATHNLAGEIVARRIDGTRYELTLTTYTDPAPAGVDRCSADIEIWSTGVNPQLIDVIRLIPRANGPIDRSPPSDCEITSPREGVPIYRTVKQNIYIAEYTFDFGKFELRYFDVARREDIINISKPGEQAFYVTTILDIPNPILGNNNTPVLLNTPLDEACAGKIWTHNPGGFDPDGDSLAYSIRPSMQYDPSKGITPQIASGYRFPDDNSSNVFPENGPLTMDPVTGLMTWDVPGKQGAYNIAYVVEEYRNGILLGSVLRDMVIIVRVCENNPPVIESITDTCITAGEILEFDFLAYDPDPTDSLYLRLNNAGIGNNGPFAVDNVPIIDGVILDMETRREIPFRDLPDSTVNTLIRFPDSTAFIDTIFGNFSWGTLCDNIRKQFYQVDFFAHDNFRYIEDPGTTLLSANHLVAITVIPPPPGELSASKQARQISLDWEPSECDNALGYNIYRKIGQPGFTQDTVCCDQSPADMGYELIAFNEGWDNITYVDSLSLLENGFGQSFCYVVTDIFQDEFNSSIDARLESCASNEICVEIAFDSLFMVRDSVARTDPVDGAIQLRWVQPDSLDDFFSGPFTYRVFRGSGFGPATEEIASLPFSDTSYLDTGINTDSTGYTYRIEVFDAQGTAIPMEDSSTQQSSSIFLTTRGDNGTIILSWTDQTPWNNSSYLIWRADSGEDFVLIDTVLASAGRTYSDPGLEISREYCYLVQSVGAYQPLRQGLPAPLVNASQESCSTAEDKTAPCFPDFVAQGDCNNRQHFITVTKSAETCDNDGDEIVLFFSEQERGAYTEVKRFRYADFGTDTTLIFNFEEGASLSGCYAITTTDTSGNTSERSPSQCVQFCPGIRLGNIFSPNDDGVNDFFTPVFFQDVVLTEFQVYDRWGNQLHTNTTDLVQLWDGRLEGGRDAKVGVYYYFIRYEELNIAGNIPRETKGWVSLIR
ncbi:MAG: gliding motility-associated C-terminal domain-containing protein [Bacteroidota bacterium]